MTGRLSVVATPIGNLEDITLRAIRVLQDVSVILAEDTRRTRILLSHYGIATPLRAFHALSPDRDVERWVARMVEGEHLALVSDAGTPLVSDPGARLVRAAAAAGIPVTPLPGPSAVVAAMIVSGLDCGSFRFVGFLPRSGARRRRALEGIAQAAGSTVLFEAPSRLASTLRDLAAACGPERPAAVCRELTKVHEEVRRGTLPELADAFDIEVKGEVTLVVEGRRGTPPAEEVDLRTHAATLLAEGQSTREAATSLAEAFGVSRREAYRAALAAAASDPARTGRSPSPRGRSEPGRSRGSADPEGRGPDDGADR
ncbi:MAG: 16S rRNA (cytidine(1402)-2'-O)-methyltransferase [Sandaracinaceae bacterium]